jgi:hypothetical protein
MPQYFSPWGRATWGTGDGMMALVLSFLEHVRCVISDEIGIWSCQGPNDWLSEKIKPARTIPAQAHSIKHC